MLMVTEIDYVPAQNWKVLEKVSVSHGTKLESDCQRHNQVDWDIFGLYGLGTL